MRNAVALRKSALVDASGHTIYIAAAPPSDDRVRGYGTDSPYKGASTSTRAGALWQSSKGSANADFLPAQSYLRERSRQLIRNNPLAAGALQTLTDNVIGPGLTVHPEIDREVLGLTDEQADKLERDIARIWCEWADSYECDLNRIQCFGDLQRLGYHSMLESGDALCLAPSVNRNGSFLQTRVQIVEADRVRNPNFDLDTDTLAGGVEMDSVGSPVAYHVATRHPGDPYALVAALNQTQRVRAFGVASGRRNAWLLYKRKRPQQARGVPYLSTVLEPLKQIERYSDAELMAAIVGGSFTVFIKSPDGQGIMPLASLGGGQTVANANDAEMALDYGGIVDLAPGEDINIASPGRPNTAFGDFLRSQYEMTSVGIGFPYEIFIKHFAASYSASQAAKLEFWKFVIPERIFFSYNFCSPYYELVITEAVARGRLSMPGFLEDYTLRRAYLGHDWRGPVQGMINPLDEVNAAKERVALGISTREREAAETNGSNFETNHIQLAKESAMRREAGLELDPAATVAAPAQRPNRDQQDRSEAA